jgi:hypothetical protein
MTTNPFAKVMATGCQPPEPRPRPSIRGKFEMPETEVSRKIHEMAFDAVRKINEAHAKGQTVNIVIDGVVVETIEPPGRRSKPPSRTVPMDYTKHY